MNRHRSISLLAAMALVATSLGLVALGSRPVLAARAAETINLQFANHIQAGLPEPDVFVESSADPGQVIRMEGEAAKVPSNLAKMLYASTEPTHHDPFKVGPNPLGPFGKGNALGFTLEQWLAGTASGTYIVDNSTARIDLSAQKLVPNGVYTVWCSRITFPPNFLIVNAPCGASDGLQNIVKADAQGNATYSVTQGPLPESSAETASLVALAYHSDGKTYGPSPGDFGTASHVQLLALLPAPQAAPAGMPATGNEGDTASVLWIALLSVVAATTGWLLRRKTVTV